MLDNGDRRPILASAAMDGTLRLWDIASQKQLLALPYADSQVNCLCITPDGSQLVAAAWQNLRIYSMKEPTPHGLHTFGVHEKNVTSLGFQADGRWMFTGGEDCMVKIWDMVWGGGGAVKKSALPSYYPPLQRVSQLNCQRIFQVNSTVHSVALHPNQSELVVADSAGALYVWDLRNDKDDSLITELDLNEFVHHVDIDASGRQCAAVTNRGQLLMWSLPHTGGIIPSLATPPLSTSTPQVAGRNRYPTPRDEPERTIQETERELGISGEPLQMMTGPEFPPLAPAPPPIPPQDPTVQPPLPPSAGSPQLQQAGSISSSAATHQSCAGRPSARVRAHNTFALKCRFRPDSLAIASTSADQTTRLWSVTNNKMIGSYGVPGNKWVWDCAFTNDGSHMITATSDGVLRMWELATNRVVRTYQGHSMGITAMAFRDCV